MKTSDQTSNRSHTLAAAAAAVIYLTAFAPSAEAANPIYINPWTCGTPIQTYYLGDSLSSPWYVNFEIGQQNWNYAQVGYGTSAAGTGYNWGVANWYEDGDYPNKRVRRDIGGLQFTSTGNWYWICQAKESFGDTYTSKSACGWGNGTTYPPSSLSYFTVNALTPPSGQSATAASGSQINLSWTKGVSGSAKDTLILRGTSPITTDPTQGTAYSAGNTIGSATVIYRGNATAFNDTSLSAGTHYYYKFYAENYSYYSAGVTADTCTVLSAPSTTGASRCGGGVVTLGASGSGGTLKWYSDAGLTTQVATGASYSPTLSSTTTFYVTETSASDCVSAASTVTGTINALPTGDNKAVVRFAGGGTVKIPIADLNASEAIASLSTPSHGSVSKDDTWIFYVPDAGDNSNDSFTYTTEANASGCTRTATITVTVVESVGSAKEIAYAQGGVTVTFVGIPDLRYDIIRASSPEGTYSTVHSFTMDADGEYSWTDTNPINPQGYYKLKYPGTPP